MSAPSEPGRDHTDGVASVGGEPLSANAANEPAAVPGIDVPVTPTRPPRRRGRIREWFWRGNALRELAQARPDADPSLSAVSFELTEVAGRLTERLEPPRSGTGDAAALVLYREAMLAAVRSRVAAGGEPGMSALARTPAEGDPALEAAASRLAALGVGAIAALTDEERRAQALAARHLMHAVLVPLAAPVGARRRLLAQRLVRTGFLMLLLCSLLGLGGAAIFRATRPPNLLATATMKTSTTYPGFSKAEGVCDGRRTKILFHTANEHDPWVEYDMHEPRRFSNIAVSNRKDCCDDRAFPFIVQISQNGTDWTTVFTQTQAFSRVQEKIAPVTARYVRVQAQKKTWLHLEKVAVW